MRYLLPIPSRDNIPKYEGSEPLTDMLDRIFLDWFNDVFSLEKFRDPARIPIEFVEPWGELLSANIIAGDSDRTMRTKFALAIDHQKAFGTWPYVKEIIDAISGSSASLYKLNLDDDFIMVAKIAANTGDIWSVWGGDDPNSEYGIMLYSGSSLDGDGYLLDDRVIYVDVGVSGLSQDVVENIIENISIFCPAYTHLYIGYVNVSKFVLYGEVY
jgi:hypothetical protein